MISVWEHSAKVDIAPVVKAVGFNTVWTHDKPCEEGQKFEDTLMYRHLHTPGVKCVIAKIEGSIGGWTHEQSLRHADWVAKLSLQQSGIIGVYRNDFYGEMDYPFDFDIDAIIFNIYNTKQIPNAERRLVEAEKKFHGKPILTGLYLNAGSERRWLTEAEFKQLAGLFIRHINEGKTAGLRIFRAENLLERPEYMTWAKEALSKMQ